MPFASNRGTRIYYHLVPAANGGTDTQVPLLLAHGFMQRCEDWGDAGYVEALSRLRPLVLLDFRGHGLSGKPHFVADYRMELLVGDVTAVLNQQGIAAVDFMGYSFGAWVGFGMAKFAPYRFRSLILGGMHPYVRDPGPLQRRIDRFSSARDALAAGGRQSELIPRHVRDLFAENDVAAMIALTIAIRDSEGFEDGLDGLEAPGLIYAGEEDPVFPLARHCVQGNPNLEFLSIPGLGHMETWHQAGTVLPHIIPFLQSVE